MRTSPLERSASPSVGIIVRSYPRLSQTFILEEIRALERLGVNLQIFAITDPREPVVQSEVADVRAPVFYLDRLDGSLRSSFAPHSSLVARSPRRYVNALRCAVGSRRAMPATEWRHAISASSTPFPWRRCSSGRSAPPVTGPATSTRISRTTPPWWRS